MTAIVGAILVGGHSSRMGEPKALVDADGEALAHRVAAALVAGGCTHLELVGDDATIGHRLGLHDLIEQIDSGGGRSDLWHGIGPLGGLATAVVEARHQGGPGAEHLARARTVHEAVEAAALDDTIVVVAACDQPDVTGELVRSLVGALSRSDPDVRASAVVTADGRRHPLPSAWRASAGPALLRLIEEGARRLDAGFSAVGVVDVAADAEQVIDLDTPDDLARWRTRRGPHLPEIEPPDP